jgi:hypothetical protein
MARTYNGNFSKSFQGMNLVDANTASTTRQMVIQNLASNATYRSGIGLFNPTGNPVTVELSLKDSADSLIGTAFTKILSGNEFQAFNPFAEAGVTYPSYSFDNVYISINPTAGTGQAVCFGATTNNTTNDPAAHSATQKAAGYENSPGDYQVLPEVIWAPASGGGTWMSEIQITDFSGGSVVSVYFSPYGDSRKGPFVLWTGPGANNSIKFANILETLDGMDAGYDYYGKVGSLELVTQGSAFEIQTFSRTFNGNYSKTLQGINFIDANTADPTRQMMIQNFTNNSVYRSAVGCFNLTDDSITVEFQLIDGNGNTIGSPFSKTLTGNEFLSFNPFTAAGVAYPTYSYDNVFIFINPTSGAGEIMCFGATSNNTTNDPAAHSSVQRK